MRVFLSHSRKDAALVARTKAALQIVDSVAFALEDLPGSRTVPEARRLIETEIANSGVVFLLLTPNAYPWYFTWIIPLLCFFPNPAWLLLTILQFLSYSVLIGYGILGTWHWSPLMLWLEYAPFYAWLAWRVCSEARRAHRLASP